MTKGGDDNSSVQDQEANQTGGCLVEVHLAVEAEVVGEEGVLLGEEGAKGEVLVAVVWGKL